MDPEAGDNIEPVLLRAAQGDVAAWQRIVTQYLPRVHGLLRAQCHDADLAEEIAQSTFCTLVSKLGEYTEQGKFEAWLFRIAMNRLRDEMRRRKRHARPAEESTLTAFGPTHEDDDDRAEPAELKALEEAMAELSAADRLVVDLRHVGGMSFRQMSEYLNEPLGTLLARHHRALHKLRAGIEARRKREQP